MTTLVYGLLAAALSAAPQGVGLPLGIPPGPDDPIIARVAPEKCLLYVNWAGTAAPDPNSTSETERLLAEPEVQRFLGAIEKVLIHYLQPRLGQTSVDPFKREAKNLSAEEREKQEEKGERADPSKETDEDQRRLGRLAVLVLTRPTAVFISDLQLPDKKPAKADGKPNQPNEPAKFLAQTRAGMVVSFARDDEKSLEELKKGMESFAGKSLAAKIERVQIAGQPWYRVKDDGVVLTWGIYRKCFIAGVGESAIEEIVARMDKQPPAWLTRALEQTPVLRRTGVIYVNVKSLLEKGLTLVESQPSAKVIIAMLGLDNATALVSTTGLDDHGIVNKALLALDGPPHGLLGLITERSLRPEDLAPIPQDATLAVAFGLDLQRLVDQVTASAERVTPGAEAAIKQWFDEFDREHLLDLRRVIRSLGDTWCVYTAPSEGGWVFSGLTAVVPIRDGAWLLQASAKFRGIATDLTKKEDDELGLSRVRHFRFNNRDIFYFNLFYITPAWCVTERELVMSINVHAMKAYLSRREHRSLAAAPEIGKAMSESSGASLVGYCDAPRLFDLGYPFFSIYGQAGLGLGEKEVPGIGAHDWPSAPSIRRHLHPETTTFGRTRDGVQITCHYCFPTGGVNGPMIWLGSMSMSGLISSPFSRPIPIEPQRVAPPATAPVPYGAAPSPYSPVPSQPEPAPSMGQPAPTWDPYAPAPDTKKPEVKKERPVR